MPVYIVTRKSDSTEAWRYQADAVVEWPAYPLADFDHTELVDPPPPPPPEDRPEDWHIHVGPFYDRFGAYKVPILASSDPLVQAVIKDTQVRKYIDLKGRRADLLQAIGLLQSKGFAISTAAVLDVKPTDAEVYRG